MAPSATAAQLAAKPTALYAVIVAQLVAIGYLALLLARCPGGSQVLAEEPLCEARVACECDCVSASGDAHAVLLGAPAASESASEPSLSTFGPVESPPPLSDLAGKAAAVYRRAHYFARHARSEPVLRCDVAAAQRFKAKFGQPNDDSEHALQIETLRAAQSVFAAVGVPFFLMAGSLLDAVRQCQLRGDDLDVAYFAEDYRPELFDAFVRAGFSPFREFGAAGCVGHELSFRYRNGIQLDVFALLVEADVIWQGLWISNCPPRDSGSFRCDNGDLYKLEWRHYDLAPMLIAPNLTVHVPLPPEQWLADLYGAEWRVPRREGYHWVFSAQNLANSRRPILSYQAAARQRLVFID